MNTFVDRVSAGEPEVGGSSSSSSSSSNRRADLEGLLLGPHTYLQHRNTSRQWMVSPTIAPERPVARLNTKNENRGESSAMTRVKSRIAEVQAPASSIVSVFMLIA